MLAGFSEVEAREMMAIENGAPGCVQAVDEPYEPAPPESDE